MIQFYFNNTIKIINDFKDRIRAKFHACMSSSKKHQHNSKDDLQENPNKMNISSSPIFLCIMNSVLIFWKTYEIQSYSVLKGPK